MVVAGQTYSKVLILVMLMARMEVGYSVRHTTIKKEVIVVIVIIGVGEAIDALVVIIVIVVVATEQVRFIDFDMLVVLDEVRMVVIVITIRVAIITVVVEEVG